MLIVHVILVATIPLALRCIIPLGITVRYSARHYDAFCLFFEMECIRFARAIFCVTLWVCDAFRVMHFLSVVLGGPFDPLEMPLLGAERPKLFIQLTSFTLENKIGIMLSWVGTVRGTAACHPSPQLVGSGVDQVRVRVRGRGRFTASAAVATASTLPLMQFLCRRSWSPRWLSW